jgi:uncharacterized protein YacL
VPLWLSNIPILIALPLFAVLFAIVGVVAHATFRRFVRPEHLIEQHEVAGFIVSVVGVLYSVVLGFLVGTVWTGFATAQETTNREAAFVADAFNFAALVPEPQRDQLQRTIAQYAIDVRDDERSGAEPNDRGNRTILLLSSAVKTTVSMPPPPASAGAGQVLESNNIRSELLSDLRDIADARRLRLVEGQDRLPAGLLEALILGAVMVVAFAFFFGVQSFFKQMAMTALMAGSIGLFFGLVVELSTPYSGAIRVSYDAWNDIIANNHFEQIVR